jgi:hypothetical protein
MALIRLGVKAWRPDDSGCGLCPSRNPLAKSSTFCGQNLPFSPRLRESAAAFVLSLCLVFQCFSVSVFRISLSLVAFLAPSICCHILAT